MPEAYTCIECENLYDWTDGDLNERMCNRCINEERNEHYKKVRKEFSSQTAKQKPGKNLK